MIVLSVCLAAGFVTAIAAKPEPSELTVICGGIRHAPGGPATCPLGETVLITGTDFPHNIDVKVVKTATQSVWYQDERQVAVRGNLEIPLGNGFADGGGYRVDVSANRGKLHRFVDFSLQ